MTPRVVQFVAVLVAAALLVGVGMVAPGVQRSRKELDKTGIGQESPTAKAPPEYAFAVQAFGAFRGLLTNIAFIRAQEYKDQGRYYDAMQLATWICKLQPHFVSVWEFNAWNMAWNISVTTHTPEERWNWVYNGLKLLRDEGIMRFNPRAVNLYKQVAWIFVNKMSETVDEHHLTYKRNWAWRMHLLLGAPPDPLREYTPGEKIEVFDRIGDDALMEAAAREAVRRGKDVAKDLGVQRPTKADRAASDADGPTPYEIVKQAAYERVCAIRDAEERVERLFERVPETRGMVDRLRKLGVLVSDDVLTEDSYWRPDGLAFTFFDRYRRLTDPASIFQHIVRKEAMQGAPDDSAQLREFDAIVGATSENPAGRALLRFLQRKVLTEVYKMDVRHMAELVNLFGPMDWRSVDAHALYWATMAILKGGETISTFSNDKTNTTRLIFFALRNLYLRNKIVFEPVPDAPHVSYFNPTIDINFIEPLHQAYRMYGTVIDPDPENPGRPGYTFKAGHINFLAESIRMLWLADRRREAEHYYQYLRENYNKNDDGTPNRAFEKPLDDFVTESFYEVIAYDPKQNMLAINAVLMGAFDHLAQNDVQRYNRLVSKIFEMYTKYMQEKAGGGVHHLLPPFGDMQSDALAQYLSMPSAGVGQMIEKARLWSLLPVNLKRSVYDRIVEGIKAECEWFQFDVLKAFPEPPGMAEYREKARPRKGAEDKPTNVETPAQNPS